MNTSTLPPGWDKLLTEYAEPGHETDPDKRGRPVTQRTRPPVARRRKTKPKGVLLKEAFVKRKSRAIGVKEYLTLNSFLRKLPAEHKRYQLPITRGMTMSSYLRRLGQKLGWTKVRLDHLLWN